MVYQREAIGKLPAYQQGVSPGDSGAFKLSSNENPFPPLPSVVVSITEALGNIHLYPSMAAPEITARIAERFDVQPANFEAYPILVQVAGATPVPVALTADERHDLPAMAAAITARTRLIFVCNPNNPTGATVTTAELHAFMQRVPADVLVVVDEAYVHFNTDPDSANGIDFFAQYPNVAVLHTFSKAYGLAGLRLGYAIAPVEVAANLRRVSVPFAVTDLAQRAAVASLNAEAELTVRIDTIVAERARVVGGLRAIGVRVADSQANFVWLRTGDDTERVNAVFVANGILARAFPGEGIRISIGSVEANDRFLQAATQAW